MTPADRGSAAAVAICSLVRDGMVYLPAYRRQLESLDLPGGLSWRLYILEGDSRDGSHAFLERWALEDSRVSIGQEHVGDASEREDRAARWARVANACLALVADTAAHTHVLWLEADLCFPPELLHRLVEHDVDVVAPIIYLGGYFYDTWGFRDTAGRPWSNVAPYGTNFRPMALVEMGSVGSCVLFKRAVLDAGIRMKGQYQNGLLVGMCQDARARGFRVFADTATAILHPMDRWEEQMWRPESLSLVHADGREESVDTLQARGWGLESNLPMLDAATLLDAQRRLWPHLFDVLDTTRLAIEVTAWSKPRKGYRMRVAAVPPAGAARNPWWRGILMRWIRRRDQWNPRGSPASPWKNYLLQRSFSCQIRLDLQDAT